MHWNLLALDYRLYQGMDSFCRWHWDCEYGNGLSLEIPVCLFDRDQKILAAHFPYYDSFPDFLSLGLSRFPTAYETLCLALEGVPKSLLRCLLSSL